MASITFEACTPISPMIEFPLVSLNISNVDQSPVLSTAEDSAVYSIWPAGFEWVGLLWCLVLIYRAHIRLQEGKILYGLHLVFSATFCALSSVIKYESPLLRVVCLLLVLPVVESLAKKQTFMMHKSLHKSTRVVHYSGNCLAAGTLIATTMFGNTAEFFQMCRFDLFIPTIYFPMKLMYASICLKGFSPWFRTNAYIPLSCLTFILLGMVDLTKAVLYFIMTTFVLPSTIIPSFFTYGGTYYLVAVIILWQTLLIHFDVENQMELMLTNMKHAVALLANPAIQ